MAEYVDLLYAKFLQSQGVSIDTRTIEEGNFFFAISGPNFNANRFAADALMKGAAFAVVDDEKYLTDDRIILVEDGLMALQEVATLHRQKFEGPVFAITGSNGKTTTKELLSTVLSEKYSVHATKGNLNNHIGVPLTLLDMKLDVDVAIVEMGANHVGEIASYCKVAQPTHGLITNIGRAHTETFGGVEGIIRGKSELFDFLRKTGGTAFINLEDRVLSQMAGRFSNPVTYPTDHLELLEASPFLKIRLGKESQLTHLVGKYNFSNIAAAVAVGAHFEVEEKHLLRAIASYKPDNARSEIIQKGSVTIILDAYNANPDSMKHALESLADHSGDKVAVLGDMNELEKSDEGHQEVLDYADELNIGQVFTVGDKIGRVAPPSSHFRSKEELEKHLANLDFNDKTVLLKASRSIKLETILNSIS